MGVNPLYLPLWSFWSVIPPIFASSFAGVSCHHCVGLARIRFYQNLAMLKMG